MSRQLVTAPELAALDVRAEARTAVERPSDAVSTLDSGCWEGYWKIGNTDGAIQIYGRTDVTWCGDGAWVTYATSSCGGYSNYITYNYIGCTNYPNYGAGWNLYQVKSTYRLCTVWVPTVDSCLNEENPWVEGQFLGDGNAFLTGSGWD
jgi:hypothetical protein